jgi:prolyl-tRNA editing enzyme YbaK/EbsC (Cys-tRNA(Pro) deacylase)
LGNQPVIVISADRFPCRVSNVSSGVPLFGHSTQLRVFIDSDLLQYDEVWAAAGTWNDVFPITPNNLVRASGAAVTDLKRA